MDWMPQAIRDGIIVVLIVSGPLVLAAALIGLIVGVLQAATQVQEQTIGSALKIIGVFGLIILAGFWMYQYLNQYTARTLSTAFTFVPRQAQKVIPPREFEGEEESAGFEERLDTESPSEPIKLLKPEKLDEILPGGGIPRGIPYLGAPEIPKVPTVSKIEPPAIPKIPKPAFQGDVPLADFQEPKTLSVPAFSPSPPSQVIQPNETNNQPPVQDVDMAQINVLPDAPENKNEVNEEDELSNPSWLE